MNKNEELNKGSLYFVLFRTFSKIYEYKYEKIE